MGYNSGIGLTRFVDEFGYIGLIIFLIFFMLVDYFLEKTVENEKLRKYIWVGTIVLTGILLGIFSVSK